MSMDDLTRPDLIGAFDVIVGFILGASAWFLARYVVAGFYTVDQNERAVKTVLGRAVRIGNATVGDSPIAAHLTAEERERYAYPQVRVIMPGGPYFKWPWETIHKVSIATQTVSMALDPETPSANSGGARLEAVTKDHLNTGLSGQLRYRISDQNLYAYLFGVQKPFVHVMGYFVSVLRERIANFEAPPARLDDEPSGLVGERASGLGSESASVHGVSINDLRKNLRDLNERMDQDCRSSIARYGIVLDACLITGIDPPTEVESALAAINTAHNHVSSEVSLAQAWADQKIVQSRRAVEIETLRAQAEVEPLIAVANQLKALRQGGPGALAAYLRNVRLALYQKAQRVYMEVKA